MERADQRLAGRVGLEDWVTVGDNDGMYNRVDPTDSRWVYNTIQWGGHYRVRPEDAHAQVDRADAAGRPAAAALQLDAADRPLAVNSRIVYTGAQVLFRSLDRGDHWEEISPDLTSNDASKISPPGQHRAVLHHHHDFGIAGDGGRHLGGHGRREGAGDAEPRCGVDRRHAEHRRRRARRHTTG